MTEPRDIIEQAIAWHLREPGMTADDWQAFAAWLAADPAHGGAYDRIALAARLAADAAAAQPVVAAPANDNGPTVVRRRVFAFGGAAIAASLAVLIAPTLRTPATEQLFATAPGAPRSITLGDGTRIEMNGATRLRLDTANPRRARLDVGEATFHVRHDAGAPFTVAVGNAVVEDVGTVFNITRSGGRIDIAVAEGAVRFRSGNEAVPLPAGAALAASDAGGRASVTAVTVDAVGSWRQGRLSFRAEPVARLAEAIHRRYGTQIVLAPGLAAAPFTGVLTMTGDARHDIPHVAALIGVGWRQDGARWTLSPPPRGQD